MDFIAKPFGMLLMWLYEVTANYGVAVILFALIVKLILMPFQMKSKRNMVRDMTDRRLMTINEGREILGLPKVPGGDVFVNRGEYMVLDLDGTVIYTSGGNLATALPPSDIEDSKDFDLGGDDQIYNDVDAYGAVEKPDI